MNIYEERARFKKDLQRNLPTPEEQLKHTKAILFECVECLEVLADNGVSYAADFLERLVSENDFSYQRDGEIYE